MANTDSVRTPVGVQLIWITAACWRLVVPMALPWLFLEFLMMFKYSRSAMPDLDQVATAIRGATVLLFNLQSIGQRWYK